MVGAQIGGQLTRRITPATVARLGLFVIVVAYLIVMWSMSPKVTFWQLAPGLIVVGLGAGLASSQLTNVTLSEIPAEKSGVASGANTTVRQIGTALGIAIIGSIITVQTVTHALGALSSAHLSPAAQAQLGRAVRAAGPNTMVPHGLTASDGATAHQVLGAAITAGARSAMLFAVIAMGLGSLLSLLIPSVKVSGAHTTTEVLETFDDLEAIIGDPRDILGRAPFDTQHSSSGPGGGPAGPR
jgi:hypothetical protein